MKRTSIVLVLIIIVAIGLGSLIFFDEYQYASFTGEAISEGFNIEEVDEKINPIAAAILTTNDDDMLEDVSGSLIEKDEIFTNIQPTSIPGNDGDHYLYLDFDKNIAILSFYMKKIGDDATFEIWGPNKKVGEGSLSDEYQWYSFDVSFKEMSSDKYALYNFGGGNGEIIIDQIYAMPQQKAGIAKHITGM